VQVIQHGRIELLLEMIVEADFQSIPKRSTGSLDPAEINGLLTTSSTTSIPSSSKCPIGTSPESSDEFAVPGPRPPLRGDKRTRVWHDLK